MNRLFIRLVFCFLSIAWCPVILFAAGLSAPEKSPPSAMVVIDVSTLAEDKQVVKLTFDPTSVQYIGPVTPSMEIQTSSDGLVEINKTATGAKIFSLKFIDLGKASDTVFKLNSGEKSETRKVQFEIEEARKSYHLHILFAAIILLFLGLYLRRYQKKALSLMSTRSLFMNFEELQKVREQYDLPVTPVVDDAPHSTVIPAETPPVSAKNGQYPPPGGEPKRVDPKIAGDGGHFEGVAQTPIQAGKTDQRPGVRQEETAPVSSFQPPKQVTHEATDSPEKEKRGSPKHSPGAPPGEGSPKHSPPAPAGEGPSAPSEPWKESLASSMQPAPKTKQSPSFKGASINEPVSGTRETAPRTKKITPVSTPRKEIPSDLPHDKPSESDSSEAKTIARPVSKTSKPQETAAEKKIFLVLLDPDGKTLEGMGSEISLGRRKGNTIVFTNSEISRNHAIIKRSGDGFTVSPVSTSNLTEVNGKPVKGSAPIKPGDTVSFGGTPFRIEKIEMK